VRLEPVDRGLRRQIALGEIEDAIFIQAAAVEFSPRDGLRFRNGRQILLQKLPPGQRIRVQSIAGEIRSHDEVGVEEPYHA
jgi:hypothetical protein